MVNRRVPLIDSLESAVPATSRDELFYQFCYEFPSTVFKRTKNSMPAIRDAFRDGRRFGGNYTVTKRKRGEARRG